MSPVVELSASKARAVISGNLVSDGGRKQSNQVVAIARNGAMLQDTTGSDNWFSGGFRPTSGAKFDAATNVFQRAEFPLFVNPAKHDYHLTPRAFPLAATSLSAGAMHLPAAPGLAKTGSESPLAWQYRHPAAAERRPREKGPTRGAYAGAAAAGGDPAPQDALQRSQLRAAAAARAGCRRGRR